MRQKVKTTKKKKLKRKTLVGTPFREENKEVGIKHNAVFTFITKKYVMWKLRYTEIF
jgi:hypothetical protein